MTEEEAEQQGLIIENPDEPDTPQKETFCPTSTEMGKDVPCVTVVP